MRSTITPATASARKTVRANPAHTMSFSNVPERISTLVQAVCKTMARAGVPKGGWMCGDSRELNPAIGVVQKIGILLFADGARIEKSKLCFVLPIKGFLVGEPLFH